MMGQYKDRLKSTCADYVAWAEDNDPQSDDNLLLARLPSMTEDEAMRLYRERIGGVV